MQPEKEEIVKTKELLIKTSLHKVEKGKSDLQIRRDVVNKTILRLIRKYYKLSLRYMANGDLIIKRKKDNKELYMLANAHSNEIWEWTVTTLPELSQMALKRYINVKTIKSEICKHLLMMLDVTMRKNKNSTFF